MGSKQWKREAEMLERGRRDLKYERNWTCC